MQGLLDLTNKTPQEWDEVIAQELHEAGIVVRKFRDYDTPHSWLKHTLDGQLGKWIFSRDMYSYGFWGDIPLSTAEVIAADKECAVGCMPGQWFASWGDCPNPAEMHAKYANQISWIADGMFLLKEEGQSEEWKKVLQHDANQKLRFVADPTDPREGGKPIIRMYTFFSVNAMKNFVEIARRHRLDFLCTS